MKIEENSLEETNRMFFLYMGFVQLVVVNSNWYVLSGKTENTNSSLHDNDSCYRPSYHTTVRPYSGYRAMF
jgi:hypothetical protein